MDRAKIGTIFILILVLVILMAGYYHVAQNKEALVGGFIATLFYLVKKIADQIDEIIDKLWGIEHKEEKPENKPPEVTK